MKGIFVLLLRRYFIKRTRPFLNLLIVDIYRYPFIVKVKGPCRKKILYKRCVKELRVKYFFKMCIVEGKGREKSDNSIYPLRSKN